MNSIEIIKKEAYNKDNEINNLVNKDSTKLTLKDVIKSINEVYSTKKQYEEIIKKELIINNLTDNIDNFFKKCNINNKYKAIFKNNILIKSFTKFINNINYINKIFFSEESKFNDYSIRKKIRNKLSENFFIIYSILLMKKCINNNGHLLIQKFLQILFLFQNFEIISLDIFKLISEIYINIIRDLIILNEDDISFLEDLIEAMNVFLNQNEDKNVLYFIISIIFEVFLIDFELKLKIQKSTIFLKLLNYESNDDKNEKGSILKKFLINIYKNNITSNILFKEIYKNGILNLNYYSNSLNLLSSILKEENMDNYNFKLRRGFYIKKDNPITLENIEIKEKEISIIFSFRLLNSDIKNNNDDGIEVFNLFEYSNNKERNIFLCLKLYKDKDNYYIKLLSNNNECKIGNLQILKETDYLICISKGFDSKKNMKLDLYLNYIEADSTIKKKDGNYIDKNNNTSFQKFSGNFLFKEIKEMKLELGGKNFEGIMGDFFIIGKNLKNEDISQLLNLNGNYSYIVEYIKVHTHLINDLDNFFKNKKEIFNHFRKLNYKCIFKILSDDNDTNFIKVQDSKNETKIKTFKFNSTLKAFINGNGIDYLVFQMHNLFYIFQQNYINQNELNIFNSILYNTLAFYYDLIIYMNNNQTELIQLNNSIKFDYFFLSFLSILYYYKKINKYLRMNSDIYNLLLEFVSLCEKGFFDQRNLILSILLDEAFFDQQQILKEGKILSKFDFILSFHLYDKDTEIFNNEILYKIFNLQFILQSKEYNHKLYMKIILCLINIGKQKIIKNIVKYIISLKSEDILYHYLKIIFINYEKINPILKQEKTIFEKFCLFLKKYYHNNISFGKNNYSFKLSHLIYLLGDKLKIKFNNIHKNSIENIDNPVDLEIKYKICEIKTNFIICFKLDNYTKLKFVKNYDSIFFNKKNEKKENQLINQSKIISLDFNLIKNIKEKKFFSNFDSIINDINNIYELFCKNRSNTDEIKEDLFFSIFEMMKYFFQELINYQFIEKESKNIFLNLLNKRKEMANFFRSYLLYDFPNALDILREIISSSISEIEYPFYFEFLQSETIIDNKDPNNNQKIKNEILEILIDEINKKDKYREITNFNREKLLLIINEKVFKEKNISNDVEKFILAFVLTFNLKNIKTNQINNFYLIEGEYYHFFELLLNILFVFYQIHNYDNKFIIYINDFLMSSKNISLFYLHDKKLLKNNKEINESHINIKENKEKKINIPNMINVLYFLIYFISKKNKNNDNPKSKQESFINKLIEIYFNNCKEIFDYINKNKLVKKFSIKTSIHKFEIYNSFYNIFTSKQRTSITIDNLEKYYKDNYETKNIINTINVEDSNYFKLTRCNTSISNETKSESNIQRQFSVVGVSKKFNTENIIIDFNNDNNSNKKNNLEIKKEINEINPINEKEPIKDNDIEKIKSININFKEVKKFDIKSILKNKDIPLVYFKKIIKDKHSDLIKIFSNPKTDFFWKTFIVSLKDMIFYNKNFIKTSKCFKMFSRDCILEKSSQEEDAFHLNYPTKIKNFICNDYYRPFLKPDINFFNKDMLKISHNYIQQSKLEEIKNKNDFNKISFIKYIPINFKKDEAQGIICENISYRGSILGKIYLKISFLAFISDYPTYQIILDKSQIDPMFFVYSFQDITKRVNIKSKTIFIYYRDIKEIIIRRFFLKRIGYEIFLKDGRSYLFNFFNLENFNNFKNLIEKKELDVINEPVKAFEKKDYKNKFKKGEISNFLYLLLINKFSSRTYNDINQY